MKICTVEGCGKKHEGKGYCKSHYRSFMRYGDPLQVDLNNAARREEALRQAELEEKGLLTSRGTKRMRASRDGVCSVDGCGGPIKAKKLCDMHYARQLRTGSLKRKNRQLTVEVDGCLVIGCEREHFRMGYCTTHHSYDLKNGTPYLAKVIKLCGVTDCYERHFGKGLCKKHLYEWRKALELHGIEPKED